MKRQNSHPEFDRWVTPSELKCQHDFIRRVQARIKKEITSCNVRFPNKLFAQLKQHQVDETTKRNKKVTLQTLIIEAVRKSIDDTNS